MLFENLNDDLNKIELKTNNWRFEMLKCLFTVYNTDFLIEK